MQIAITDTVLSTWIVIAALMAVLLFTLRKSPRTDLFSVPVTQELKGLGMLTIVFAHISYMLVTDSTFLYPLSIAAGVGVDLFLLMSGYGLTIGMLKKPMPALSFYKRRLIKVFIPFWLVLLLLLVADAVVHGLTYPASYMLSSLAGWFPNASAFEDINSPFWYITWMLMFYLLFPLLFMPKRPWLTAILLAVIANVLAVFNPFNMQTNWLHHLHTNAFSLGMVLAWLFIESRERPNLLVAKLKSFRAGQAGASRFPYYLLLIGSLLLAGYMAIHNASNHWPKVADTLTLAGFDSGFFIGQATSLLTMAALIIFFMFKKLDCLFLNIFGVYSYETYLLHWPLMSRYDLFYHHLPAWLATIAWLVAFMGIGWVLQKITHPIGAWIDRQ
ncbi:MAG: acyltransferase family protein [Steroidobacteraceae bacterium]